MKKFLSLLMVTSMLIYGQACSVQSGLAGLSPQKALNGVQSLLGLASGGALKGIGKNMLTNAVVGAVMPPELKAITGALGGSEAGQAALGVINNVIGSAAPNLAKGVLDGALKNIPAAQALDILKGGENGATNFLKNAVGSKLNDALLPAMTKSLGNAGIGDLVSSALGSQAGALLGGNKPSIESLLTTATSSGIFGLMGAAEKAERANPTNDLLKEIFSGK